LSGSDDQFLVISDPFDEINSVKHRIPSGHDGNIFSARFLPETNASMVSSRMSELTALSIAMNISLSLGLIAGRKVL
jgi:hypothetical protein